MASAQSLLGLVNQLQNMEMCFTSILMEGAMKLSALTDAKIFILVETPEGRRFCGRRHLCDAYVGGLLTPEANDVELEINTDVSAVQERHLDQTVEITNVVSGNMNELHHAHHPPRTRNRKRKSASSGGSSKRSKENESYVLKTESGVDAGLHAFHAGLAHGDGMDAEIHLNGSGDVLPPDDRLHHPLRSSEICQENMLSNLPVVPADKIMQNLPDIPSDKLMALQCVPPEEALTKGTVGFKLLNSILYDLGKRIAHVCCRKGFIDSKDPRAKAEFSSYFDAWVNDNLRHLIEHGLKIFDGNQNRSAMGFMKYITRTNFNSTMKGFVTVKKIN